MSVSSDIFHEVQVISMALTIYDISQKAGVSIATVSRVINGIGNVRPSTKQKVMDVIEQYGYTPNAFARGMGLNSDNRHTVCGFIRSVSGQGSFSAGTGAAGKWLRGFALLYRI